MSSTKDAQTIIDRLERTKPLLTGLREIAKEHGKNQEIAARLWKHGARSSRMLSFLMLDLKVVDVGYIEMLVSDIEAAAEPDRLPLSDWMTANVIMKKTSLQNEARKWRAEKSILKQRVFWSVQARTASADNRELNRELLELIERDMASAPEMVQWNMNWWAAQIGIADESLRARCIKLGERLGLYTDYPVPKGCTSPYLPIWIESVVAKKGKK